MQLIKIYSKTDVELWWKRFLRVLVIFSVPVMLLNIITCSTIKTRPAYYHTQKQIIAKNATRDFASEESLSSPITLKAVTFNVWGIPFITPHISERIKVIGESIVDLEPDIVCIQEIWTYKNRQNFLNQLTNSRLHHSIYFKSKPFGSGLLILSAYPIVDAVAKKYAINGKWYKPWHGDWYGGKGIELATIQLPHGKIDIINTHLVSKYNEKDEYQSQRIKQLLQLSDFISSYANNQTPTLLFGDFNCKKGDPEYDEAVNRSNLVRLLNGLPDIDNIFAVGNSTFQYKLQQSFIIKDSLRINGKTQRLSDHHGYVSIFEINPMQESEGLVMPHLAKMEGKNGY